MTWEQQWLAIKAICPDATLEIRGPGDWYVSAWMHIGDGGGTLIGNYGNGATPELAVKDHWRKVLEVEAPRYWRVGHGSQSRAVRWTGFMWKEVA